MRAGGAHRSDDRRGVVREPSDGRDVGDAPRAAAAGLGGAPLRPFISLSLARAPRALSFRVARSLVRRSRFLLASLRARSSRVARTRHASEARSGRRSERRGVRTPSTGASRASARKEKEKERASWWPPPSPSRVATVLPLATFPPPPRRRPPPRGARRPRERPRVLLQPGDGRDGGGSARAAVDRLGHRGARAGATARDHTRRGGGFDVRREKTNERTKEKYAERGARPRAQTASGGVARWLTPPPTAPSSSPRARPRAPARGGERGATRDLDRARGIGASEPRARPTRRPAGSATSIARRERRPWRAPRCVAFARKKSDTTAVALRAPRDDGRTTGVARPLESSSRTQPRVRDDRRGRVRLARNAPSPSRLARAASRAERCLPAGSRRSTLRPASPSTSIRRPVSEGSDWFACSRDEGFS